ncbi:hypothetical protein DSO57_1011207 [Entomophthora muscae]|uniref:Uncharacterized protein n=1 Tax=Entomophthora muscae TaxID=34485 RepID=A0ACC2RL46_9FUNG|nr:hypothetical protein DSO57_1011207 [Entomophthora muscae]
MKLIFLLASSLLAGQPRGTWKSQAPVSHQMISYRGHILDADEINYSPVPDTGLNLKPPDEQNAAAYSRWDGQRVTPRASIHCGLSIRLKTYPQELLDTYTDKFRVITGANNLVVFTRKATKILLKTMNKTLEDSFAKYLLSRFQASDLGEHILKIDGAFSQASTAVDLIQADATDNLAAIYAAARGRAVEITVGNAAVASAELTKPGIMAHTLKTRAKVIERMHQDAIQNLNDKVQEFRSRAVKWYYQLLDKQYYLTLLNERD